MSRMPPIPETVVRIRAMRQAPRDPVRGAGGRRPTCAAAAVAFAFSLGLGCAERTTSSPADAPPTSAAAAPSSGARACTPVRATGESPLIDDFEAAPGRILGNDGRGGWWYSYDDGTRGQRLREEVELPAGRALHVAASDFNQWGSGFGANLHPASREHHGCPYDASVYAGIRVRARGRGRLRVTLADATNLPPAAGGSCDRPPERCYDRPGVWLDLEEQWRTYEFPFCAFTPEGWGGSKNGIDPARLFGIHFRIGKRENVEAWLDDVAFYRAPAGAAEPQCKAPCPLDAVPRTARIQPRFSTAPLGEELTVHTFAQPTTSCGPITRRYLSYVPGRLGSRSPAPVLILLHGSGGNAEAARTFLARDRFDALAARDGFIVVYGNAAPGAGTRPNPALPNNGVWRQAFFDDGQVDDVAYLELVLADLQARGVTAGNNPVLLAGLSNGGGMVLEAARRIPHRLRGIAALMPFDGQKPEPIPDLSQTSLKRLFFAYSIDDPVMSRGYHDILAPQPALWAAAMGIPASAIAAPQRHQLPDVIVEGEGYRGSSAVALATRDSRATEIDLEAPDGSAQVRVLVLDHAGHFWPNRQGDSEKWVLERYGFRNQDVDAADMVWEFLRTAVD